jgi:hypothetical protein
VRRVDVASPVIVPDATPVGKEKNYVRRIKELG